MKHYIIAKFKDKKDTERLLPDICRLFDKALLIDGVTEVKVHPSCSDRENRYSIMIEMTMTEEGLSAYDASEMHKEWKRTYGDKLESKAIFDCLE